VGCLKSARSKNGRTVYQRELCSHRILLARHAAPLPRRRRLQASSGSSERRREQSRGVRGGHSTSCTGHGLRLVRGVQGSVSGTKEAQPIKTR
jgi:hypothetical protein